MPSSPKRLFTSLNRQADRLEETYFPHPPPPSPVYVLLPQMRPYCLSGRTNSTRPRGLEQYADQRHNPCELRYCLGGRHGGWPQIISKTNALRWGGRDEHRRCTSWSGTVWSDTKSGAVSRPLGRLHNGLDGAAPSAIGDRNVVAATKSGPASPRLAAAAAAV